MFSRSLLLAFSLSAFAFGTGCASQSSGEDVASDEGAATSSVLGTSYEGTIGNLKVMIHLDAQGSAVTGSYFYADKTSNGDVIKLSGTATGAKLALNESVNGKATGSFAGTIASTGITGTWKNPAGSTSLPLALKPITAFKTVTRKSAQKAEIADKGGLGPDECSSQAEFIEVFGAGSAKADAAINAALTPIHLELNAAGKCEFGETIDVRQTVKLNAGGFLTVQTVTDSFAGAHPEISISYANFKVADGSTITGKDIFAAGAATSNKVKALVVAAINGAADMDADTRKESLEALDQYWGDDLNDFQFGLNEKGLTIDLTNNYPHVIVALAPAYDLKWSDIKPLLKAGSPVAALAK